jgi:hypothetical protein
METKEGSPLDWCKCRALAFWLSSLAPFKIELNDKGQFTKIKKLFSN